MKLATLRNYFGRVLTTKLYVTTDEFAIAGQASNPKKEQNGLLLDVTPYVIFGFAKGVLESSDEAKTLLLTSDTPPGPNIRPTWDTTSYGTAR